MKLIPLTQGQFAKVDDEDFEYLNQFKWCAVKHKHKYYASRKFSILENNKRRQFGIYMHRDILINKKHEISKYEIDHINHDTLDNRFDNLRICTKKENTRNKSSYQKSTSRFLGVSLDKNAKINKWRAKIATNNKGIHIGRFNTEIEAAKAYNVEAIKLFGEYASINII